MVTFLKTLYGKFRPTFLAFLGFLFFLLRFRRERVKREREAIARCKAEVERDSLQQVVKNAEQARTTRRDVGRLNNPDVDQRLHDNDWFRD